MMQRNREMFSCLGIERLASGDMMDELLVYRDKPWTDGSDAHQSQRSISCVHPELRGTSSGNEVNYIKPKPLAVKRRNTIEYPAQMQLTCLRITVISYCLD